MPDLECELDVRWGDMDSFGHVSNVVYLRYLEECRGRWFGQALPHWESTETGPVIANININYRTPIVWPCRVKVSITAGEAGRSSVKLANEIRDAENEEGTLYADASTTIVWIDRKTGEPVRLPVALRKAAAAPRG